MLEDMYPRRKVRTRSNGAAKATPVFNAQTFLASAGVAKSIVQYGRGEAIFAQGDACEHVLYIQSGGVKLSVLSKTGKEAVVAMLGPGEFFGELALVDDGPRSATVVATSDLTTAVLSKWEFRPLLKDHPEMAWKLIEYLVARVREEQTGRDALIC